MNAGPVRLTVPADSTVNLHGHDGAVVALPVTDSGAGPVSVTAYAADITAHTQAHPGLAWVRSITPHTLHLRAGQTGRVMLTIRAPASAGARPAPTPVYVNVIFKAGASGNGTVKLAASVGGTLRITHAGTGAAVPAPAPQAAPAAHAGTGAGWGLALIVLAALAVMAVLWALLLRRRARDR